MNFSYGNVYRKLFKIYEILMTESGRDFFYKIKFNFYEKCTKAVVKKFI